jgi:hypothetical protein
VVKYNLRGNDWTFNGLLLLPDMLYSPLCSLGTCAHAEDGVGLREALPFDLSDGYKATLRAEGGQNGLPRLGRMRKEADGKAVSVVRV